MTMRDEQEQSCLLYTSHRDSRERTAVYHSGGRRPWRGGGSLQGKNKDGLFARRPAKEAAAVYAKPENPKRSGVYYPNGQAYEPQQHLAGNESPVRAGKRCAKQGVSA